MPGTEEHRPDAETGPGYSGFDRVGPSTDILAGSAESTPLRRAPWLLVGAAGVGVLALVAGVTYGVGSLSGAGSQPEDALPAGAFGFAKLDLDPSAGQKIDGFRFMRKFPALSEKLGNRDDLREVVFEEMAREARWDGVDFDADVAPWLGQRVGVAAYPPSLGDPLAEPMVVVALQVSDAEAARAGLDRMADATPADTSRGRLGFVVTADYALLAETQAQADQAARDAEGSVLADDAQLAEDLAAAPDGILTAWLDSARMAKSLAATGSITGLTGVPGLAGVGAGRSTYVARFDGPDVFELVGTVTDAEIAGWAEHPVAGVDALPESSVVAVGLADGDALVPMIFAAVRKTLTAAAGVRSDGGSDAFETAVAGAEQQLGIELPDDLAVLLGDNLVLAVDGPAGGTGTVEIGARIGTDADRAEAVLDKLIAAGAVPDVPLVRRRVGPDLVVAGSESQADRLSSAGSLGDLPAFRQALPDLEGAEVAVWVDVPGLSRAFGRFSDASSESDENIEPIDGVGVTAVGGSDGTGGFRFRLVAH